MPKNRFASFQEWTARRSTVHRTSTEKRRAKYFACKESDTAVRRRGSVGKVGLTLPETWLCGRTDVMSLMWSGPGNLVNMGYYNSAWSVSRHNLRLVAADSNRSWVNSYSCIFSLKAVEKNNAGKEMWWEREWWQIHNTNSLIELCIDKYPSIQRSVLELQVCREYWRT